LTPSSIDVEFNSLCTNNEDFQGIELVYFLLVWVQTQLDTGIDFELIQAYLHRILSIHSELIRKTISFSEIVSKIKSTQEEKFSKFEGLVQSNLCLLKLFSNITFSY
jgi:hypothetical protein